MRTLGLLLLFGTPLAGLADGGFFGKGGLSPEAAVTSAAQEAILIRDGEDHEILILQTAYHGPAAEFAWVIPVPGLPTGKDVFPASPKFIDRVFSLTAPQVTTDIYDPRRGPSAAAPGVLGLQMMKGVGGMAGGTEGVGPTVTVHERQRVGDYDASILSATGAGVLIDWLNANGYAFPSRATDIARHYVRKKWYFVALRVHPEAPSSQAVLFDVKPVGIRFPTHQLVYPLQITRVSAGERNALLLVLLSRTSHGCAELPVVDFPERIERQSGASYPRLREELLKQRDYRVLACEARRRLKVKDPSSEDASLPSLPLAEKGSLPQRWHWTSTHVTRLFGLVPRAELVDLTFPPVPGPFYQLQVHRTAPARLPWWVWAAGTGWGIVGLHGLVLVLLLIILWRQAADSLPTESEARQLRQAAWWLAAVLLFVGAMALVSEEGHRLPYQVRHWWYDLNWRRRNEGLPSPLPWLFGLLLIFWIAPGIVIARRLIRGLQTQDWPATVALTFLGAGILLALVLWTFPGWQGLWALIVLWIIGAFLLAFAVVAVLIRLRASQGPLWRALAAVGQATLGTLLLCPFILAFAGIGLEYHPRTHWELRRAQHEIGQAIQTFKAQTGGYPSRLADLTASSRPAMGLDASGNAVSLQAGATGPLLKRLPKDPLTGRRDTWIYDVLATPPVESGAFHLQVLRQPSP